MLTPAFELTQNEDFLIVAVQVPYAKATEIEVHFEDNDFLFYSKPYYLRLNLPGKVLFCEEPSCKYDFDKRVFTVQAPKVQKGEVFEGLDLVTLLLAPRKGKTITTPKIEVIEASEDLQESEEDFDWDLEQVPVEDQFGSLTLTGQQCGFANSYSFSIFKLEEESAEIFDVTDPQNKTSKDRTEERLQKEADRFDEDHYVADLYQDEEIQLLLKYSPEWEVLYDEIMINPAEPPDDKIHFTSEEKEILRKLPNKEYLLDKSQARTVFLGLIDILFAYAYNKRTTEGESNVESAWTINKISATLSWLEYFVSVPQVAVCCIRRSLTYPLFRHFELSVTVLEDVRKILMLGRKYVIKCLLEVHGMFCCSEPRYILNDLFISDYIVWMQTKMCSSKKFAPLAQSLEKILLTKGDIGLHLVDIESFAAVAWMSKDSIQLNTSKNKQKHSVKNNLNQQSAKSSASSENQLCSNLKGLTIVSDEDEETTQLQNSVESSSSSTSEYEMCSSCTSSENSSSTSESDSSTDSDDDSDEDTETPISEHELYQQLIMAVSVMEPRDYKFGS